MLFTVSIYHFIGFVGAFYWFHLSFRVCRCFLLFPSINFIGFVGAFTVSICHLGFVGAFYCFHLSFYRVCRCFLLFPSVI